MVVMKRHVFVPVSVVLQANVFSEPVSTKIFEDYTKFIFHPVCLQSLREVSHVGL